MDDKAQNERGGARSLDEIPLGTLGNKVQEPNVDLCAGIQSFEDLMELAGTSGRWNIMVFVIGCYCSFVNPMQLISYEFLGATPDHWCHVDVLHQANWTQQQILHLAIPKRNDTQSNEYESCQMYDYNYELAVELGYEKAMDEQNLLIKGDTRTIIPCYSRDFNLTQYKSTIVTEWDLVCERRALYSTTQAVSQFGNLLGFLILGPLLDYFGRRRVVLASVILSLLAGFATAISNTFVVYIVLKTIVACVITGFYMGCFVIVMELCSPSQRSSVGSMFVIPWALGYMTVPGIAYLVREWRWLQAAYTLPNFTLLVYFWLLPESPRWLITKGRYQEAMDVLSRAARVNGRTLPSSSALLATMDKLRLQEFSSKETEVRKRSIVSRAVSKFGNLFVLLVNPKMRVRTIIIFMCWFVGGMVYYGLSLNSSNLSANAYLYVFLGGLTEIPSYLLLWPSIAYLGRRTTLIGLDLICAACITVVAVIMFLRIEAPVGVVMLFSLSGKVAVTMSFHLLYIYTTELYPTSVRSLALSLACTCGRAGSVTSPYINDILGQAVGWGPSALFAATSIGTGSLALLLPETKDANLIERETFDRENNQENNIVQTVSCDTKGFDHA